MISLIVARDRNGAIGKSGDIPWRAPEDLAFFKRETLGGAVVMGRRTWESLPQRPLPKRLNCVITRAEIEGDVLKAADPVTAVAACYAAGYSRVYGIGGHGIYASLLPHAHRMLITEVDIAVQAPDTYFPDFDLSTWHELEPRPLGSADPVCTVREFIRKL